MFTTDQLETILEFLPKLKEYVEGYAPSWDPQEIVETPEQELQAETHAIMLTAYEHLYGLSRGEYALDIYCPACGCDSTVDDGPHQLSPGKHDLICPVCEQRYSVRVEFFPTDSLNRIAYGDEST